MGNIENIEFAIIMISLVIYGLFFGLLIGSEWPQLINREGVKRMYKNGQIDAINGKIKYRLEKNEIGEMVWVEIKDTVKEKS